MHVLVLPQNQHLLYVRLDDELSKENMAKQVNLGDFQMTRTLGVGSFGRVKFAKYKQDH